MGFRKVQKDFEMIDKLSEGQNKIENGQGTYTYPNGEKYVGEWKDGEQNGQGTETYPDGSKYIGEWRNGDMWNGTEYDKDGNIQVKIVNGVKQLRP